MIHYVLCCNSDYNSSASYNRVRLITEGLNKNGIAAKVFFLFIKRRKSKILNIIEEYFLSYLRHSFQLLRLLKRVDKNDVVIIYDFINQYWALRLLGKKTNLIVELTEYPLFERNYEKTSKIRDFIYTYYNKRFLFFLKYASLLITCSSFLQKYYSKYNNSIILIPLVVDLVEFSEVRKAKSDELGEYIAYCGSFVNNKDGLPILIDSFKLFHNTYSNVKLVLIGSGPKSTVDSLKNIISNYGLQDSVILTGSLPHNEVCQWLAGASILALARPNNRQAEGGIPSKVGEYLACGVPCVITKTGDLPNYLHDGVDCFLCAPNSVEAFAKRLEDCYLSERDDVGRAAINAAKQFSNVLQAKHLADTFKERFGDLGIKNQPI